MRNIDTTEHFFMCYRIKNGRDELHIVTKSLTFETQSKCPLGSFQVRTIIPVMKGLPLV